MGSPHPEGQMQVRQKHSQRAFRLASTKTKSLRLTHLQRRLGSQLHRMSKKSLPENGALVAQLKSAAELLEAVAADRTLLAGMSKEDRVRLLQAAGQIFCP